MFNILEAFIELGQEVHLLSLNTKKHFIWQRLAEAQKPGLKKLYLNFLTRRLKKYETEAIKKLDAIAAISDEDVAVFGQMGAANVYVSPTGLDLEKYPLDRGAIGWPS